MVWREQKYHCTDCYFCLVKTSGFNKKNKSKTEYPNLPSAIRPLPHLDEIPLPVFEQLPPREDLNDAKQRSDSNDEDFEIDKDSVRKGFDQRELNDLARAFGQSDKGFEFYHNIPGLLKELGLSIYNPNEWRMFIDSSKLSLMFVLLPNGIYLVQSLFGILCFCEEHEDVTRAIELLQYDKHNWIICVDLKMV